MPEGQPKCAELHCTRVSLYDLKDWRGGVKDATRLYHLTWGDIIDLL